MRARNFLFASAMTLAAVAAPQGAKAADVSKAECQAVGPFFAPETVGNLQIQVIANSCHEDAGLLAGGIATSAGVAELDKDGATILANSFDLRKPDGPAALDRDGAAVAFN